MKKLKLWIIISIFALVLLLPEKYYLKDGGTVVYHSYLYRFEKVHALLDHGVRVGYRFQLLGLEIFDNTIIIDE